MSENPFAAFTPKKEWLVCVDSDGCAMDTMDSKHHQAFCPQLIRVYGLEEYAGLITPHWMEVNLYSRTAQGVRVMRVSEGTKVISLARVPQENEGETQEET